MTAKTTTWRENLTSPLTWHYVGFAILLVAAIAMGTRFGLDWAAISAHTQCWGANRKPRSKPKRVPMAIAATSRIAKICQVSGEVRFSHQVGGFGSHCGAPGSGLGGMERGPLGTSRWRWAVGLAS